MLLKPGKTVDEAIKFFEALEWGGLNDCRNEMPGTTDVLFSSRMNDVIRKYTQWTDGAMRQIRQVVADPAVAARLRSDTYWVLIGSDVGLARTFAMMNTEISEIAAFFRDCANELRLQKERFKGYGGRALVVDTNTLLHCQRFDYIPWGSLYGKDARLAIPHVVVDEIDRKSYGEGGKIPKRARGVYKIIESCFDQIDRDGYATLSDGTVLDILTDDPGHPRLANNDDEIVAQAALLDQAISPLRATVISRDQGMRARARTRNLQAEKLPDKYLIPEDGLTSVALDEALASITPASPH